MNAQRQVVRNVWKGWNLAKSPLIVSPIKCKKDHDDSQLPSDENPQVSWSDKLRKLDHPMRTSSELLKLIARYEPRNDRIIGSHFGGSYYSTEQIYTVFEGSRGNNRSRLDVFPVLVTDSANSPSKELKNCKSNQLPKTDVSVQTDSAATATKCTSTSNLNRVLGNCNVENELGNELAKLGLGVEALDVWQNAADTGCVEAMYNIAMCYANGEYVKEDLTKAVFFWNKASKLGHALSVYQMAVCYINGYGGVSKNVGYGWKLMKQSASNGCAEAQFSLGCRYLLNGNVKGAKKQLANAVRKQDIFERVNLWLTMDSVPNHVKTVLETVLSGQTQKKH